MPLTSTITKGSVEVYGIYLGLEEVAISGQWSLCMYHSGPGPCGLGGQAPATEALWPLPCGVVQGTSLRFGQWFTFVLLILWPLRSAGLYRLEL